MQQSAKGESGMVTKPGIFTGTKGTSGSRSGTAMKRSSALQGQDTAQTGVRDATYDLISVVYHALQGAETYKMYEEDVERTQDSELAQFFRQACEEEKRRAQQGKALLARHLQKESVGGGAGQQLQAGGSGQQRSASGSRSGQQSQKGSSSSQMRSGSSPRGQQSQQGSSSSQQGSGSARSTGSSGSGRNQR
jgi:hypothetical protein